MWRGDFCAPGLWGGAFRRDGSHGSVLEEAANTGDQPTIVPNENPLNASDRALRAGDEREIASRMRAIDAIGARHGINVAFLVPPVFETDRRDSVVNQIFDHALSLVPNIAVIDHRHMHSNPAYFNTPIHPSRQYYRIVAEEILRRHLIE